MRHVLNLVSILMIVVMWYCEFRYTPAHEKEPLRVSRPMMNNLGLSRQDLFVPVEKKGNTFVIHRVDRYAVRILQAAKAPKGAQVRRHGPHCGYSDCPSGNILDKEWAEFSLIVNRDFKFEPPRAKSIITNANEKVASKPR